MKFLGEIVHISKSGRAILRSRKLPKIGEKVYMNSEKSVGYIFDVFGPVEKPFVAVSSNKDLNQGSRLFIDENSKIKKYKY